jgi:endonuclease G
MQGPSHLKFEASMIRKLAIFLLMCTTFALGACPDVPLPSMDAKTVQVCHAAYASLYDADAHVPRLVAYELTRPHTLGCLPRAGGFHSEGPSAKPAEYNGTGYDLGHMMSAEDASWSETSEHDSFSMVNVAPQLPGLNRQEWERLEETVRAWAWERKDLYVYVGPILSDKPKVIGDGIAVPVAFFKVLVDASTGESLAFVMPQKAEAKGDLSPWVQPLSEVERLTGIHFHAKHNAAALWPADLTAWRAAHRAQCSTSN